jgi:hypothetical protein
MIEIISGADRWKGDQAKGNADRAECRDVEELRVQLLYEPFPKQEKFHSSPAKYRLFGGAAGPGKTKALLLEAVMQAVHHGGANTLLLRRTFPELEASLLNHFRRDIPRELYGSFNESKHVVEWVNGSTTRFGYCASEHDVYQYQGAEYLFIGIDELTLFTLRQWQFLTSRNRCPLPGSFPCMAGATNPGNIGHAWVKALWIDKKPAPGMERPEQYDAADYDFIAARLGDNPIYAVDENYKKTLEALPTHLKRAFLDGDWDVFAGQYFDKFDVGRHIARAESLEWRAWWPRWISIDWGFEHPAASYWHAQTPLERQAERAAAKAATRVITYREYVTHRTTPRELAREIIARSVGRATGERRGVNCSATENIDAIYLSPDAFARRTDEASIAEQMGDVFAAAGFPRPIPADDDRIGGWMLMYQMLDAGEWLLTDSCIELIRTLPTLVRDTARIEDVEKMDGDDSADAARYGLKSRYSAQRSGFVREPLEQRLAQRITSLDPTVRAIQARKAQLEEEKRMLPVSFLRRRR